MFYKRTVQRVQILKNETETGTSFTGHCSINNCLLNGISRVLYLNVTASNLCSDLSTLLIINKNLHERSGALLLIFLSNH